MAKYIIEGGNRLRGEISISGNKNAVFPCIGAALLSNEEVILSNVPQIQDVEVSLEILRKLGALCELTGNSLKIKAQSLNSHILPPDLMIRLRGSVVLVGAILAKLGKVEFTHPGGDIIGKRNIDTHINGLKDLGFATHINDLNYKIFKKGEGGNQVFLDEASVTATEILILTSVLGQGEITLKNCAKEPHVVDLCQMLNSMGAQIKGVGESSLKIVRVAKLKGTNYPLGPDYLEMATYAAAAAITGGEIKILNCSLNSLEPVILALEKIRINIRKEQGSLIASSSKLTAIPRLQVNIWPGFPTDLMSVFIVLATQARGVSLMHDWMYESRMFFADKLISMGANITIADPHRVLIYGPTKLHGRELETPDIRAGMALVLASLAAKGKSIINRAELIERGYSDVVENLTRLGANIQRID